MSTPTLIRPTETTPSTSTAPPTALSTPTATPPASAGPAELLRRAAAGHADAWAAIVARYTPMLQGRVRRYRLQDADAHDVIQVTWLRLAQNLDRIHTLNGARTSLRRHPGRRSTLGAYTADVPAPDHTAVEQITGLFPRQPAGHPAPLSCPDRATFTDWFTGHVPRGVATEPGER